MGPGDGWKLEQTKGYRSLPVKPLPQPQPIISTGECGPEVIIFSDFLLNLDFYMK